MPGEVQGLSPTPSISLAKASASEELPLCPKGRWLNKAAPWDPCLPLEVPAPGICFVSCICSACFDFTAPLYRLIKSTRALCCCLQKPPADPSDTPFPFCGASCGSGRSSRGKQRAVKDRAPTAPEFSSAELLQWLQCLGRTQDESGASHHLPLKAHVGLEEIPHAAVM